MDKVIIFLYCFSINFPVIWNTHVRHQTERTLTTIKKMVKTMQRPTVPRKDGIQKGHFRD